jgi:adenylate cyclase
MVPKSKDQLIAELRERVCALEEIESDRDAIERELKATRQRLQHLLAVSPAIIYTTKASGDYACTYVSGNLQAIMGYTPEEMTTDPKCWPDHLHPEDARRVLDECPRLVERGRGTLEYRFRRKEGGYIWILDTFRVVYDDAGRPLELVGAWADVTDSKHAEQAAVEAQRYLTSLIESSSDAIISTDKEGKIVLINEGAERLLGYQAKEVIGRPVAMLYGSEAAAKEVFREMRKRGGTVSGFDSVARGKDGSSIPVLISASMLHDADGREAGTVGFITDMRERKREQEALRQAYDELEKRVEERTTDLNTVRERFQYLLTVTPGIIYTTKASGDYACTFVSENVDTIMGFSPWEMLEDPGFWFSRLHPEDASRVAAEMGSLIERGGGALEYRFRNRAGNYIWIQDTFRVIRGEGGRPLELVGSWADISYHKQAEQALGERMAIMKDLQTLVAASPSVIYTTTQAKDGYACRFVSENLTPIMGYLPWEMRDNPTFWAKHVHPDDAERVFSEVKQLIVKGGGTVEYRFRHRRGHYVWVQDSFTVVPDREGRPRDIVGSWADISDRKRTEADLKRLAEQVERHNRFICETFGRYLTDEVVATVLESPTGLQMGGEKRKITMLMADLRGFTSLCERLPPERVVALLNRYLTTMVSVIKQYQGTIDEFIGDAIFVLFGAPIWQEDDAQRAVACAVAMQLAMASVNEKNRQDGLPEVEMGIGVHTGQVVVGNIGSAERTKYGVVGGQVNLTSRIQSFTTGGQILISEATRREVGPILKLGKQMEVKAKGIEYPVTVSEVLGIGRPHQLFLPEMTEKLVPLGKEIPIVYTVVEPTVPGEVICRGALTKLSRKAAEARLEHLVDTFSNLEIQLGGDEGEKIHGTVQGKIIGAVPGTKTDFSICFTSIPPEVDSYFRSLLAQATAAEPQSTDERKRTRRHSAVSKNGRARPTVS